MRSRNASGRLVNEPSLYFSRDFPHTVVQSTVFKRTIKLIESTRRHDLSDAAWLLLEPHSSGHSGQWGGIAHNNRRFDRRHLRHAVARYAVIWNGKRLIPSARSTARSAALALMASVAEFVIRLTGQCAINAHLQYELQLPNRCKRAEISVIRVGMLILRDAFRGFNDAAFRKTIKQWASAHPVFSI